MLEPWKFYLTHAIFAVENVLNLVLAMYFGLRVSKISLIHANLRVLLVGLVAQYSVMDFGRIAIYINAHIENDRLAGNVVCLIFRVIHETGIFVVVTSIAFIGLERTIATFLPGTYERKGCSIAKLLVSLAYFFGCLTSILFIVRDTVWKKVFDVSTSTTSCETFALHPQYMFRCYSGAMLFSLYRYNQHRRRQSVKGTTARLAERYQYTENIATLRVIVPAIAGYIVIASSGLVVMLFTMDLEQPPDIVDNYMVIMYIIAQPYGPFFAVVFFVYYPPLRQLVLRDLSKLRGGTVEPQKRTKIEDNDAGKVAQVYFDQLQKSWQ
ncbi:Protein SRAB-14 a [Aphelenchoides avenae]|nr:Protein SRAB-14 a [Aphelenchus avenae]